MGGGKRRLGDRRVRTINLFVSLSFYFFLYIDWKCHKCRQESKYFTILSDLSVTCLSSVCNCISILGFFCLSFYFFHLVSNVIISFCLYEILVVKRFALCLFTLFIFVNVINLLINYCCFACEVDSNCNLLLSGDGHEENHSHLPIWRRICDQ